jgi:hypothetical protein
VIDFPITILLKDDHIQVVSSLPPTLLKPLVERVIDELKVPSQERYAEYQERDDEETGTSNALFRTVEGIRADALCLLVNDGNCIFAVLEDRHQDNVDVYRQKMREKLIDYLSDLSRSGAVPDLGEKPEA